MSLGCVPGESQGGKKSKYKCLRPLHRRSYLLD